MLLTADQLLMSSLRRVSVVAILVVAFAVPGCCTPGVPAKQAFQQINTPETAYTLLKQSIENDQQNLFYYLLAGDVRNDYPYWMITQGWSRIKEKLGVDVSKSKLLAVEYLDESPFKPRPAARIVVEYPHPEGGRIVESFLLLLELDRKNYRENFPQWRVYYPYETYQRDIVWFRELQEQEQGGGDGGTVNDGGGSGSESGTGNE